MNERISSQHGGHWLVFNNDRHITGCHCGFEADMDSDCGWGDSVVDHIYAAGRAATAADLEAVRVMLHDTTQGIA